MSPQPQLKLVSDNPEFMRSSNTASPSFLSGRVLSDYSVPNDLPSTSSTGEAMATEGDLTDQKLRALKAETDTKFAELLSEIRLTASDLKGEMGKIATHMNAVERSTSGVKATIIGVALATIAIVIGVLGYGQQWFGIGMSTREIVRAAAQEFQHTAPLSIPK